MSVGISSRVDGSCGVRRRRGDGQHGNYRRNGWHRWNRGQHLHGWRWDYLRFERKLQSCRYHHREECECDVSGSTGFALHCIRCAAGDGGFQRRRFFVGNCIAHFHRSWNVSVSLHDSRRCRNGNARDDQSSVGQKNAPGGARTPNLLLATINLKSQSFSTRRCFASPSTLFSSGEHLSEYTSASFP